MRWPRAVRRFPAVAWFCACELVDLLRSSLCGAQMVAGLSIRGVFFFVLDTCIRLCPRAWDGEL
jgi:hypothetical protein